MKKSILLILSLCITVMSQALTVVSTAGGLATAITNAGGNIYTLTDLTVTGTIDATDFTTMWNNMSNLSVLDLSGVTIVGNTIPDNAFSNKSGLTSVKMPSSVTSIGSSAFTFCSGLTSVIIPSSVTTIGSSAFYNCVGLTTLTIPSSVTTIGASAFYNCTGLTSIFVNVATPVSLSSSANVFFGVNKTTCALYVPKTSLSAYTNSTQWKDFTNIIIKTKEPVNVVAGNLCNLLNATVRSTVDSLVIIGTIDARDFKTLRDSMPLLSYLDLRGTTIKAYTGTDGTGGTSIITYPAKTIPTYAFYNSTTLVSKTSLKSLNLPLATTSIGTSAFVGCSGLTSLMIPSMVNSIGQTAFARCSGLTLVTIPSLVTTIGSFAFQSCTGLTSIIIPLSVTFIEYNAFRDCAGFITVDAGNPNYSSVGGILFNKTQTELIQCTISKIGSYTIPSSVTSIGSSAFYNCTGLTSVTIPSSVTSIESYAFYYCSGLTSIYANSITPISLSLSSAPGVFYNVNKTTCTLHVPVGSKAAYQSSAQWSDFTTITADIPTDVHTTTANLLKVSIQNGQVVITDASVGKTISIYNLQGTAIYKQQVNAKKVAVSLPARGVYIVQVGSQTIKIIN